MYIDQRSSIPTTNLAVCEWIAKRFINRNDAYYINRGNWQGVEYETGKRKPLTGEQIAEHVVGRVALSAFATGANDRGRWIGIDLDNKTGCARIAAANLEYATTIVRAMEHNFFLHVILEHAGRDGGIHLWILFDASVESWRLHEFGHRITEDLVPWRQFGLPKAPEVFPKQRTVKEGDVGSSLRLPGRHPETRFWSSFYFQGDNYQWGDMTDVIRFEGNSSETYFETCYVPYRPERELIQEARAYERPPAKENPDGIGGIFAAFKSWEDILEEHGWSVQTTKGTITFWRKPDGDVRKYHAKTDAEYGDKLFVWSDNAPPFAERETYTKWQAYCLLKFDGDSEAAEAAYLNCEE